MRTPRNRLMGLIARCALLILLLAAACSDGAKSDDEADDAKATSSCTKPALECSADLYEDILKADPSDEETMVKLILVYAQLIGYGYDSAENPCGQLYTKITPWE